MDGIGQTFPEGRKTERKIELFEEFLVPVSGRGSAFGCFREREEGASDDFSQVAEIGTGAMRRVVGHVINLSGAPFLQGRDQQIEIILDINPVKNGREIGRHVIGSLAHLIIDPGHRLINRARSEDHRGKFIPRESIQERFFGLQRDPSRGAFRTADGLFIEKIPRKAVIDGQAALINISPDGARAEQRKNRLQPFEVGRLRGRGAVASPPGQMVNDIGMGDRHFGEKGIAQVGHQGIEAELHDAGRQSLGGDNDPNAAVGTEKPLPELLDERPLPDQ